MKRNFLLIFIFLWSVSVSQETIKIMTYNLLNFGNYTSYCTQDNNSHVTKAQYLKTIIKNQEPDILAVCELGNNIFYMNYILGNSLNVDGTTRWARIEFTNMAGAYLVNGLFYDKTKFSYDSQNAIEAVNTGIRDINIYKLKCINQSDDTYIHIVVAHLKAGNTSADRISREEMITSLMNRLNNYSDKGNNFILVGDLNIYTSTEPAFQKIINPGNTEIAFFDPINQIGDWNNNSEYSYIHTQSTHTDNNDCHVTGGLDDRFDFILTSSSIIDGSRNVKYVENTYQAVGQDGNRLNRSLISPVNTSLPEDVVNALYNMSDHLPVVAEFRVGNNNASSSLSSDPQFYARVVNPVSSELKYEIKTNTVKKIDVKIYTSIGEKIFSEPVVVQPGGCYSHNISNLPNGMYILTFEGEGIFKSYKIVKTG
jgi:endonuclease/exonuclease/phosphatase family metal-dependent hydrolase